MSRIYDFLRECGAFHVLTVDGEVYQVELPENFHFSGMELLNIRLPETCNVISITRNGELLIPRGKTKLLSGDELLIVSQAGSIGEVRRALKLKK